MIKSLFIHELFHNPVSIFATKVEYYKFITTLEVSMRILKVISMISLVYGCSSVKRIPGQETVIARMDNLESRPAWFKEEDESFEDGQYYYVWGRATLSERDKIEIGLKIAEMDAKAKLASMIEEKISSISQSATEMNPEVMQSFKNIITQNSKIVFNQVKRDKKFWEKVVINNLDGGQSIQLRTFQLIAIDKFHLKSLMSKSLASAQPKVSDEFAKKMDEQWSEILKN
jgi:hypothetical protein